LEVSRRGYLTRFAKPAGGFYRLASSTLAASARLTKENNLGQEIKCPFCGRKKAIVKQDEHVYLCTHCDKLFDPKED